MTKKFSQQGKVLEVTSPAGGCTVNDLFGQTGADFGGVYLATAASGAAVSVAFEGVFTVAKKTGTGQDFALGEKVYRLATGTGKAAPVTGAGTKIPLGMAAAAAVTGATEVTVRLCQW